MGAKLYVVSRRAAGLKGYKRRGERRDDAMLDASWIDKDA
jgi:hypothetical protein